jgi:GNAT superfamily N-acetyltransferase
MDRRVVEHLRAWLGDWPDRMHGVVVVGAAVRDQPGWDGHRHSVIGITDNLGNGVVSVPPDKADAVKAALAAGDDPHRQLDEHLPGIMAMPGARWFAGVFRWSLDPVPFPDAGRWEPADGPDVPDWLHPFGGEVLIERDERGAYLAGVGLKRHHPTGIELSVGTEPAAQGKGLARRLVAKAARRVVDGGAVATYLHDPSNVASAHVAEAAGFPDRGWHVYGLWPGSGQGSG